MKRFMKRGTKQQRMRHIWKTVKSFYSMAEDYNQFNELAFGFFYDDASSEVDMAEYLRIVKAVKACM